MEKKDLLTLLKNRFEKNKSRHPKLKWEQVLSRLEKNSAKLKVLTQMEATGGEPDVIGQDPKTGQIIFCDCSQESPKGRRSFCYDGAAQRARAKHPPQNNAVEMATKMGIELLDESAYQQLQQLGEFDTKTSSWLKTPPAIRKLGGAVFGDRRYDHVFIYHNGADSYYANRGFRGLVRV